jgi:hypothetical protein
VREFQTKNPKCGKLGWKNRKFEEGELVLKEKWHKK